MSLEAVLAGAAKQECLARSRVEILIMYGHTRQIWAVEVAARM